MKPLVLLTIVWPAIFLLSGCGGSSPDTSAAVPEAAKAKAVAASKALFEQLSGRLTQVMSTEGPAAAITVCSQEASSLAEKVSQEQGVAIGRTALKLRNTQNKPPEWAKPLLDQTATEPQFVGLDSDKVGAILPIKLKSQCLMCHGPEEAIAPDVRSRLEELYPNDRATGFREGDLRGWFWVEVPISESR